MCATQRLDSSVKECSVLHIVRQQGHVSHISPHSLQRPLERVRAERPRG